MFGKEMNRDCSAHRLIDIRGFCILEYAAPIPL